MGILRVGIEAASSVISDQWREYFYCPSLKENVLIKKGENKNKENNKGNSNIISNGSIITINEGQCMMIVEQGAIVEFSSTPGEFIYDNSTEPSIFYDGLKTGITESFKTFKKRFTMAGSTGKDQRIYYFNTKELLGNKYGTANPIPFRVLDTNIGLDIDISIRCHGEYAYKIVDPILFYKNIAGNIENDYTKDKIDSQLKSELLTALQPALGKLSIQGIRYSSLPAHTVELVNALNEVLAPNWGKRYGIEITSFGFNSIKASEEDEKLIKDFQAKAILKNPGMAAAQLVEAQSEAMKLAASNKGTGAMMAFAGLNMATNTGGMNMGNLFQMNQNEQRMESKKEDVSETTWLCSCGVGNKGKFCMECGKPKPVERNTWSCSCGTENKGKFCMECGKSKPAGVPQYKCDKCGWEPKQGAKLPKFCPECGDIFDDGDIIK